MSPSSLKGHVLQQASITGHPAMFFVFPILPSTLTFCVPPHLRDSHSIPTATLKSIVLAIYFALGTDQRRHVPMLAVIPQV